MKEYIPCYFAFIDLLGFKEIVKTKTCSEIANIFDEAKKCYDRASGLMDELGINDPLMLSLYNNNVALLYIDRRDYKRNFIGYNYTQCLNKSRWRL